MSLKAIKEGLRVIVHDDMDAGKCTKCRMQTEIVALEKAARAIVDGGGAQLLRDADYHESVDLLAAIAKEAK